MLSYVTVVVLFVVIVVVAVMAVVEVVADAVVADAVVELGDVVSGSSGPSGQCQNIVYMI